MTRSVTHNPWMRLPASYFMYLLPRCAVRAVAPLPSARALRKVAMATPSRAPTWRPSDASRRMCPRRRTSPRGAERPMSPRKTLPGLRCARVRRQCPPLRPLRLSRCETPWGLQVSKTLSGVREGSWPRARIKLWLQVANLMSVTPMLRVQVPTRCRATLPAPAMALCCSWESAWCRSTWARSACCRSVWELRALRRHSIAPQS